MRTTTRDESDDEDEDEGEGDGEDEEPSRMMTMTVLVMTMMHVGHATPSSLYPYVIDGRSAHPRIGKATLTPNPEVVLLSPRSHTWLEASGFKYISCHRLIPHRSQPLVPQGRVWLEA